MPESSSDGPLSDVDPKRSVDDLHSMSQWDRAQFTQNLAQATVNYLRRDRPELEEHEAVENIRDYYAVVWRYIDAEFHRIHPHPDSLPHPSQSPDRDAWPGVGDSLGEEFGDDLFGSDDPVHRTGLGPIDRRDQSNPRFQVH